MRTDTLSLSCPPREAARLKSSGSRLPVTATRAALRFLIATGAVTRPKDMRGDGGLLLPGECMARRSTSTPPQGHPFDGRRVRVVLELVDDDVRLTRRAGARTERVARERA